MVHAAAHAVLGWLNTPALTTFGAPTTWAEVLGFLSGALCVYLVAVEHAWNWPVGILNNALWLVLFASAGLFGDSSLQVVYVVLSVWGWWVWLHGGTRRGEIAVSRTSRREWGWIGAGGVVGTVVLYFFLGHLTSSTVPLWDAVTTALSLCATYGQAKKKVESWWLWIAADVIYVPLYQHKGLTLTAILYVGFILLCVKGLLNWRASVVTGSTTTAGAAALVGPAAGAGTAVEAS